MDSSRPEPSKSRPFVVVLTGGPCAGKTSAMAFLRDRLSKRGFQVLTVPENATHFLANSEGFQAEWAGNHGQVCMQRIFLDFQITQEDAFKAFGKLHPTKPSVLLLDCCTLNSKVYLSDEQWKQVLELPGHTQLTEQQLFARYDLVIHMVSCAFEGLYEWGPGSNNPGRYHSPEEAKESDNRSLAVFDRHPQVRVVPHFPDFESKMQQVLHFLNDALHIDGLTGKRCRKQVRVQDFAALEAVAAQATSSSYVVTSTFLDDQMQQSLRRRATVPNQIWLDNFRRLTSPAPLSRTSSYDDIEAIRDGADVVYEQRSQVNLRMGNGEDQPYLTRRLIKERDYYASIDVAASKHATVKFVLGFLVDSSYFELFFFPSYKEPVLDVGVDVQRLPAWLELTESSKGQDPAAREPSSPSCPKSSDALETSALDKRAEASLAEHAQNESAIPTPQRKRRRLTRYTTAEAACGDPSLA